MTSQTGIFTASDGYRLHTRTWARDLAANARGIVVIQHGLGEHSNRYDYVASALTATGYTVYALDARGHGETGTTNKDFGYFARFDRLVDDLAAYIQSVAIGEKTFLIGHSMGGLIALVTAIRYPERLRAVALSAPANDADPKATPLMKTVGNIVSRIAPRTPILQLDPQTISRDPAVVEAYIADPLVWHKGIPARVASEILKAGQFARENAGRFKLPVRYMHGGADTLVKPVGTDTYFAATGSADKTLKAYDGLRHEILNEPERDTVIAEIVDWMAAH